MTASDVATLHAALLDDPSDLAARYAYADALDEAGNDRRAAFVRASLAGLHVEASIMLDELAWWAWFGNPGQSQGEREKRLRVNVQAQTDGVLVQVWVRGGPMHRGYQSVIRNGLIDEFRGPISQWLAIDDGWRMRDSHPIAVYRPAPGRERADRTVRSGLHVQLWQDGQVGRLRTLDLRAICATAGDNGYFLAMARHAWRPWRGLGEVMLASGPGPWQQHLASQWGRYLTPPTQIVFGEPLEDV